MDETTCSLIQVGDDHFLKVGDRHYFNVGFVSSVKFQRPGSSEPPAIVFSSKGPENLNADEAAVLRRFLDEKAEPSWS